MQVRIILLLLLPFGVFGQVFQTNPSPYKFRGLKGDSLLIAPTGNDTVNLPSVKWGENTQGAIFYKKADSTLWVKTAYKWLKIGSGITDTALIRTIVRDSVSNRVRVLKAPTQTNQNDGNANGAIITGDTLQLKGATSVFPGIVTTGSQEFSGDKIFYGNLGAAGFNIGSGRIKWSNAYGSGIGFNTFATSAPLTIYVQKCTKIYDDTFAGDSIVPAKSAILDVMGVNGGFLPPRMTTAQRNAITSPVAGLMLFNNDDSALHVYRGIGHGYKPLLTDSSRRPFTFLAPLTITTTSGGVTIPRMTDSEVNAIASPIAGTIAYNSTANQLTTYNGSFWQVERTSVMPSNVSFSSTASVSAVSGLSVAITAGTWVIEVKTHTNILSSGGGWRYALSFPANDNGSGVSMGTSILGGTTSLLRTSTSTLSVAATTSSDFSGAFTANFILKTSVSGDVTVLAAQSVSSVVVNTIFAGSFISAKRIL